VILAGLSELYNATGNSSLLSTAQSIADAAILKLNAGGVLNEPRTTCGEDIQSFKGIYVRGLKELSSALNIEWYASFFENQVNSIISNDTNLATRWDSCGRARSAIRRASTTASPATPRPVPEDALVAGLSLATTARPWPG
jgi:Glycosyl hydrolase family 76